MIRRSPALLLVCALGAARALAAPAASTDFKADQMEFTDREWVARGHASYPDGDTLFTADEIHYYPAVDTVVAIGHVALTRGTERLLASTLTYHRFDGTLNAENVRAGSHPFYVSGDSAEGTKDRIVIHHAEVSYNEPGRWRPTVKADQIIYSPNHYLRLGNSRIGVNGLPMIPLWHGGPTIDAKSGALNYVKFSVGYRSTLGGIGTAALRVPISDEASVGGDLSLYTSRGVMAGPAAQYQSADGSGDLFGKIQSGFIADYGDRSTDLLGNPVPRDRGFVDWQHQEQVTSDLTVAGEFNWWKDSEVLRDFRPKEFYGVQEPDSYLESVDTGTNFFASVFGRFQPDSFEPVEERLPELRFDLLPTAIGDGFYERLNSSAVSLVERPVDGGPELSSHRLDMFYGLSRPIAEGDWFSFTPVAGGRVTNYTDTTGAAEPGGYTRTLGEVGFDALLHSSGVFAYENPTWDIDGLRHLLMPHISYRYIPDADSGHQFIPAIDRQSFSTYLQPLELGDVSYIDDLHPINTLRIGLDNTLQTRDEQYGSRDLLTFNADEDLLFRRQPGEETFSEIHTNLGFTPAKWLNFTVEDVFTARTLAMREVETGFSIHDGDAWSLHLGNDFVRQENDAYIADFRVRLNEMYSVHLVSEYDDRQHLFPEQSIALEENLVNTWAIRYIITLSNGPNRSGSGLGFNVQFDLIKF